MASLDSEFYFRFTLSMSVKQVFNWWELCRFPQDALPRIFKQTKTAFFQIFIYSRSTTVVTLHITLCRSGTVVKYCENRSASCLVRAKNSVCCTTLPRFPYSCGCLYETDSIPQHSDSMQYFNMSPSIGA